MFGGKQVRLGIPAPYCDRGGQSRIAQRLMPAEMFKRPVSDRIDRIKAVPCQPGVEAIRIPSERAFSERARRRVEGLGVERKVVEARRAL